MPRRLFRRLAPRIAHPLQPRRAQPPTEYHELSDSSVATFAMHHAAAPTRSLYSAAPAPAAATAAVSGRMERMDAVRMDGLRADGPSAAHRPAHSSIASSTAASQRSTESQRTRSADPAAPGLGPAERQPTRGGGGSDGVRARVPNASNLESEDDTPMVGPIALPDRVRRPHHYTHTHTLQLSCARTQVRVLPASLALMRVRTPCSVPPPVPSAKAGLHCTEVPEPTARSA
jgi:hypothetical protein